MKVRVEDLRRWYPVITGHRGFQERYPENTMASFAAAVEAGADVIEMDVHLTRDGVPVIIHDETVDRTTDGRGRVGEMLLKEIRQLDAGRWFGPQFAAERVPTLQEVLDRFGGRVVLNVEIKVYDESGPAVRGRVEREVVRMVAEKEIAGGVLVSSFDADILARAGRMTGAPALALISKVAFDEETLEACRRLGVFSFHPRFDVATGAMARAMHGAGIQVYAFGADSADRIGRLAALGADGAIAKNPRQARRWWPQEAGGTSPN